MHTLQVSPTIYSTQVESTMPPVTKRPGNLLKCLGFAIIIQVAVGLILVASALLKTETNTNTPIKLWSREVITENLENRVPIIRVPSIKFAKEPSLPSSKKPSKMPLLDKPSEKISISETSPKKKKNKPDLSDSEPIKILQWTGGRGEGPVKKCDVPCFHTSDRSASTLSTVSAIVFHIPSFGGNPRSSLNGKASQALTVALSMESGEYYRRQKDLSDYDLTVTCSFDSDLPVTYYGWDYNLLLDVSDWPWERREPAIVFVAKNCHSRNRRETLVKMLQKYVRVDSVSSCMNNHQWPPDIPRSNKDALQKRYLMYLAAENSIEKDYVTEKVYGGLINGAVPLYLGSPTIEEFVPTHSVIPVPADFTEEDVKRIANIAKTIIANKTVYEEWIEFKKHPYEEKFKRKFAVANTHIWCRLCRKLYAMKNGLGWDKELQEIIFD